MYLADILLCSETKDGGQKVRSAIGYNASVPHRCPHTLHCCLPRPQTLRFTLGNIFFFILVCFFLFSYGHSFSGPQQSVLISGCRVGVCGSARPIGASLPSATPAPMKSFLASLNKNEPFILVHKKEGFCHRMRDSFR